MSASAPRRGLRGPPAGPTRRGQPNNRRRQTRRPTTSVHLAANRAPRPTCTRLSGTRSPTLPCPGAESPCGASRRAMRTLILGLTGPRARWCISPQWGVVQEVLHFAQMGRGPPLRCCPPQGRGVGTAVLLHVAKDCWLTGSPEKDRWHACGPQGGSCPRSCEPHEPGNLRGRLTAPDGDH